MVIAMGESAVGGALDLEKWCHLLGSQPLCFSEIFRVSINTPHCQNSTFCC